MMGSCCLILISSYTETQDTYLAQASQNNVACGQHANEIVFTANNFSCSMPSKSPLYYTAFQDSMDIGYIHESVQHSYLVLTSLVEYQTSLELLEFKK